MQKEEENYCQNFENKNEKIESKSELCLFILEKIKKTIKLREFLKYFQHINMRPTEQNLLYIDTANIEHAQIIFEQYLTLIQSTFQKYYPHFNIQFEIRYQEQNTFKIYQQNIQQNEKILYFTGKNNEFSHNFQNFIQCESNKEALEVCKSIACYNENNSFNDIILPGSSVFISGKYGTGKTHLAKSIEQFYTSHNGKVFYITGFSFLKEYVREVKNGKVFEFFDNILKNEIIIFDGIETVFGKKGTSIAIAKIVQQARSMQKYILLTSSENITKESAEQQKICDSTLLDIITSSLQIEISDITSFDREKILIQEIAKNRYNIPLNIAKDLSKYKISLQELKMSLKKLSIFQSIRKIEINSSLAKEILNLNTDNNNTNNNRIQVPIERIKKNSAKLFEISIEDLNSELRSTIICRARNIAMFILHTKYKMPYQTIGKIFGNRRHSTVISSIKCVLKLLETDSKIESEIAEIGNI